MMNFPGIKNKSEQSGKEERDEKKQSGQSRKAELATVFRQERYHAGITVVVIAIVILVNLIAGQLPSHLREFDITDNKLYTVSDVSREFLSGLAQEVEIVVLGEEGTVDQRILKFLDNYGALSSYLSVKEIDTVVQPQALTEYGVSSGNVVVRCESTGKQKEISLYEMITYDYNYYYYYGIPMESEFDAEGLLTSAVDYVTGDTDQKIYYTTGHGEASLPDVLTSSIDKANLQLSSVSLLMDGGVPEDCDLLVIYQPKGDLAEDELAMLRQYLQQGGQVLIVLPDSEIILVNWESLLGEYGLAVAPGYIADMDRYYQQLGSAYAFFPELSSTSELTSAFYGDDLALVIDARGMTETEPARDTIEVTPFMTTSENAYAVTYEDQTAGVYVLGAVSEEETDGGDRSRLTVISAATLTDESIIASFPSLVNLDLFMNAVTVGMEEVQNITVPAKSLGTTLNVVNGAGFWSLLFIAVIPFLTLIGGLVYWNKRRKY